MTKPLKVSKYRVYLFYFIFFFFYFFFFFFFFFLRKRIMHFFFYVDQHLLVRSRYRLFILVSLGKQRVQRF